MGVCVRARDGESMCVCVGEIVCVCIREREGESMFVCVCVFVRSRKRLYKSLGHIAQNAIFAQSSDFNEPR